MGGPSINFLTPHSWLLMLSRRMYRRVLLALCGAAIPSFVQAQHSFSESGSYDPTVPTPQSVLGYEVGDRFTPHHMIMRYLDRLAATSRRVKVDTVARTFEGRELVMVVVTSEANQGRIEQIRADNERLATLSGSPAELDAIAGRLPAVRSEERRVGKECRSRWAANHEKKQRRT